MDKYKILKEYFGYTDFRGGQADIIDAVLSGRNVLGIMPTGAGKSICFQVPALMMDGITIVVSPLISLMKDQVEALVQNGINAAYINSTMDYSMINDALYNASRGEYKIIYVAPERLCTNDFLYFASNTNISMLTIDEAHCISQWGNDFRPSYLKINEFYNSLPVKPIISAFTATATKEVRSDIISRLDMRNPFVLTASFDRKNLYFSVIKPIDKFNELKKRLIHQYSDKTGIIYCNTRKNVDAVYDKLILSGFKATKYHAGLNDSERKKNQEDFIYDKKNIIVATNAFGMGIDKSDVRFVIHYNMPKDMESYYQEAGRAGRDGAEADCIIFYNEGDIRTNQFIILNSELSDEIDNDFRQELKIRDLKRLDQMIYYCKTKECLRHYILDYFGEESPNFCGRCNNCNTLYEDIDITIDSQKILSCIIRAKQNYGVGMITDILRGSKNKRLMMLGFDKLKTYGIMKDKTSAYIKEVIDFLKYNKYIILSGEYSILKVTNSAKAILKGELSLTMKTAHKEPDKPINISKSDDNELFAELRRLRTKIALEQNLPTYIIFSDASLHDMCVRMPENEEEFLRVSGVGDKKLQLYGEEFIKLIKAYKYSNLNENRQNIISKFNKSSDKIPFDGIISLTNVCKNILSVTEIDINLKKLRTAITNWLSDNGYISRVPDAKGRLSSRIGEKSDEAGIVELEKEDQKGNKYCNVYYTPTAQEFIVRHFNDIMEHSSHE